MGMRGWLTFVSLGFILSLPLAPVLGAGPTDSVTEAELAQRIQNLAAKHMSERSGLKRQSRQLQERTRRLESICRKNGIVYEAKIHAKREEEAKGKPPEAKPQTPEPSVEAEKQGSEELHPTLQAMVAKHATECEELNGKIEHLQERARLLETICRENGIDVEVAVRGSASAEEAKAEFEALYQKYKCRFVHTGEKWVLVDPPKKGAKLPEIEKLPPKRGTEFRTTPKKCTVLAIVKNDEILVIRAFRRDIVGYNKIGGIYRDIEKVVFHVRGVDTSGLVDGSPFSGDLFYVGTYSDHGSTVQSYIPLLPLSREQFRNILRDRGRTEKDIRNYLSRYGADAQGDRAALRRSDKPAENVEGVEKGNRGSERTTQKSPASDWINLLAVKGNAAKSGTWRKTTNGMETDGKQDNTPATWTIAYLPKGEYDCRITFTLSKQDTVGFGFPVNGKATGVHFNSYRTGLGWFGYEKRQDVSFPLVAGKKHIVLVNVRKDFVTVIADGRKALECRTPASTFANCPPATDMSFGTHVHGTVTFHSAELRQHGGD